LKKSIRHGSGRALGEESEVRLTPIPFSLENERPQFLEKEGWGLLGLQEACDLAEVAVT
jgi:hypothetical protein